MPKLPTLDQDLDSISSGVPFAGAKKRAKKAMEPEDEEMGYAAKAMSKAEQLAAKAKLKFVREKHNSRYDTQDFNAGKEGGESFAQKIAEVVVDPGDGSFIREQATHPAKRDEWIDSEFPDDEYERRYRKNERNDKIRKLRNGPTKGSDRPGENKTMNQLQGIKGR